MLHSFEANGIMFTIHDKKYIVHTVVMVAEKNKYVCTL